MDNMKNVGDLGLTLGNLRVARQSAEILMKLNGTTRKGMILVGIFLIYIQYPRLAKRCVQRVP